jgi:predicted kinase
MSPGPRLLLITCGTAGSGKSTVAGLLARAWRLVHLQTDVVRKQLAGLAPMARTGSAVYGGIYTPGMSDATYAELNRQAEEALQAGASVILDGTFLTRSRRAAAVEAGRRSGVPVVILRCHLERAEQLRRLAERLGSASSVSEGGPEVMERHEQDWEPLLPSEADAIVEIDTRPGLGELETEVLLQAWSAVLRAR